MYLPVSRELMVDEIESSMKVLNKWSGALQGNIPGIDVPGSEEQLQALLEELSSELQVVASKVQSLALIVGEKL